MKQVTLAQSTLKHLLVLFLQVLESNLLRFKPSLQLSVVVIVRLGCCFQPLVPFKPANHCGQFLHGGLIDVPLPRQFALQRSDDFVLLNQLVRNFPFCFKE